MARCKVWALDARRRTVEQADGSSRERLETQSHAYEDRCVLLEMPQLRSDSTHSTIRGILQPTLTWRLSYRLSRTETNLDGYRYPAGMRALRTTEHRRLIRDILPILDTTSGANDAVTNTDVIDCVREAIHLLGSGSSLNLS